MSYFEREQKYNMKYEIWRAWAKIWNMKYENIKIQRTKNVTISGFFFANMKYENFFILAWNTGPYLQLPRSHSYLLLPTPQEQVSTKHS